MGSERARQPPERVGRPNSEASRSNRRSLGVRPPRSTRRPEPFRGQPGRRAEHHQMLRTRSPPAAQRTHGMAAGSGGQPPREPHSAQLVRARARLWPRDTGPVRQEARTPRRAHADVAPADGLLRPAGAGAAGKPAPAEWPRTTAPPAGIRDIMAAGPGASRARQQAIEEQPGAQPTSCPGFDDASQFHSWPPVGAHRRPRLRALSDRRAAAKWRWNHKTASASVAA